MIHLHPGRQVLPLYFSIYKTYVIGTAQTSMVTSLELQSFEDDRWLLHGDS